MKLKLIPTGPTTCTKEDVDCVHLKPVSGKVRPSPD